MKTRIVALLRSPKIKKVVGVVLIIVGVLALITPLTPGSWLALIGFELLGVRILLPERFAAILKRARREKHSSGPPGDKK
ncbi:MAG: hypothetical protein Q8R39_02590 [bacterium]|nr:hypothetical protein [bacterium]MDZ4284899.1 hypothetical protein [Patescibacteria group bacterium]